MTTGLTWQGLRASTVMYRRCATRGRCGTPGALNLLRANALNPPCTTLIGAQVFGCVGPMQRELKLRHPEGGPETQRGPGGRRRSRKIQQSKSLSIQITCYNRDYGPGLALKHSVSCPKGVQASVWSPPTETSATRGRCDRAGLVARSTCKKTIVTVRGCGLEHLQKKRWSVVVVVTCILYT